jgi:NIPSNAP
MKLFEVRTYILKIGAVSEYLRVYQAEGLEVQTRILGNMIGYFYSEIGPLNQVMHIWAYDTFEERQRKRTALMQDQQWLSCLAKMGALIETQENKLMYGAAFSPLK